MDYQKIINRLNEILQESEEIQDLVNSKNKQVSTEFVDELDRIISWTYNDDDKKSMLKDLYSNAGIWSGHPSEELRDYKIKINNIQRTCKKMIKEYNLFGFEDFKPIKETITEDEKSISAGKLGVFGYKNKKIRK